MSNVLTSEVEMATKKRRAPDVTGYCTKAQKARIKKAAKAMKPVRLSESQFVITAALEKADAVLGEEK